MLPRVVALTDEHVEPAGSLLAARHRRERARCGLLPPAPEDPAIGADLVAGALAFSEGVCAIDETGDLVGFLTVFEQSADPSSPSARYLPERSAMFLVQGHAVAGAVDPGPVYAALFEVLAARFLDKGVLEYVAHVPIGEPGVEAAWSALGFGRANAVAVRDLASVPRPPESDAAVRVATSADHDVVDRLVDVESVFHAGSPIFRPYVREQTIRAVRAELASQLAGDAHCFFIARVGGRDVGVLSIGPGLGSPLYVPDSAAYIAATAVVPEVRGRGVGTVLADAAFSWASDHGYRAACLHFATANMTSSAFWTGIGFIPVMVHVRRRLDDRILSCRPSG